VSWALLRARCRSCGVHIPARYPLVEALSGALWLSAGLLFGATIKCGFGVAFLYLLMILSFIDWDTMRLPNPLVALLAAIGFIGAVFAQLSAIEATPLISASGALSQPLVAALAGSILAMAISLGIAALYSAVRRASGFGMGDVKLLGAMGPFLGLYVLMALFFGSLIGAIYGIAAMRSSGKTLRTKVPFGPFLAIGGVIALWFGPALWSWYAGIAFGSV
jgi:leader peptidase (prepilin peptidase)/N-methyltransferase